MATTSPVIRFNWNSGERESERHVEWSMIVDSEVVVGFQHPLLPQGSLELGSFLDEFLSDPGIAQHVSAAENALAETIREARGGDTLKSLRLSRGLSQGDLAKALDTSQSRISRLETRVEKPSETCLRKLSEALSADFNTIMDALARADR